MLAEAVSAGAAPHAARATRVLFVMDHFATASAGTERQLLQLLNGMDRQRCEPQLAVLRWSPFLGDGKGLPCPVHDLGIARMGSPTLARGLGRLASLLVRLRADVAHVIFNDAAMITPPVCRLAGARVVASRRDMGFWYTPAILRALRFSGRFVDVVAANCEAVRRNVHQREGIPLARIEVIPNGHDWSRFDAPADATLLRQAGVPAGVPVVGIVANLTPVKRHADLVRAFAILHRRQPGARLVLVGQGPEHSPLMSLAGELGIDRQVHVLTGVHDPIPLVKAFDVAVLCSESEGLSNALLEYAGCARPIVCTAVGGNTDVVHHGETGLLVGAGDIEGLAQALETLVDDREAARAMGERARVFAMSRFDAARMVEAYESLYDRLRQAPARARR